MGLCVFAKVSLICNICLLRLYRVFKKIDGITSEMSPEMHSFLVKAF
jgi:hypothetical protein